MEIGAYREQADALHAEASGERLVDGFGRVVDDLRLSLTDRCNFRCVYCMPAEGLAWLPSADVLTLDEIARLARIFVSAGVKTLRLTGGEPLVRSGIVDLVATLRELGADLDISLTTNGFLLKRMAAQLAAAGLNRVNVSLDSLDAARFESLARRDALERVLAGIDAAKRAGLTPIKVNTVVMRGVNDKEAIEFARLARRIGVTVRFIEYMPLDAEQTWERDRVVAGDELLDAIESEFPVIAKPSNNDPATRFTFADGAPGEIGFINSVSAPFCSRCNRVRITADGQLRTCLFAIEETDIRTLLRDGSDDASILAAIRHALMGKGAGHEINAPTFVRPLRSMSQIGG